MQQHVEVCLQESTVDRYLSEGITGTSAIQKNAPVGMTSSAGDAEVATPLLDTFLLSHICCEPSVFSLIMLRFF